MFLTTSNLVHYLTARELVRVSDVVNGDYSVSEAGRHNRNFKVLYGEKKGLFIKQIPLIEDLTREAIFREAFCYQCANDFLRWNQWMLNLLDYDRSRHCLSLELYLASQNLREFYYAHEDFPNEIAALLGQALADLRSVKIEESKLDLSQAKFGKNLPWIFTYHENSRFKPGTLSGGAVELGEIVRQRLNLKSHLQRVADGWKTDALVHGDMKWDNCLVRQRVASNEKKQNSPHYQLKLIDWELVDIGDSAWDIGAVFQAYLSHWIMRRYRDNRQTKEELLALTYEKMPTVFSSISCFWNSYCHHHMIDREDERAYLLRCLEFGAVRLLQTTFESLYCSSEITAHALAMLELSEQILNDPEQAAGILFGLPR